MKEIKPWVEKIKAAYPEIEKLDNDALRAKTEELKKYIHESATAERAKVEELKASIETLELEDREEVFVQIDKTEKEILEKYEKALDEVLPVAFSIVKATAKRFTENEEIVVTATDFDRQLAATKDFVRIEGDKAIYQNHWVAGGNDTLWNLLNFRDFIEDTTAVELGALFSLDRLWVPLLTVAILFLIGGALPGRIFARIPVSQVFRRYTEGKKGWKCPLLFVQFAGVAFICGLMYVVMLQYYYVLNKDLGYNPKRVVVANTGFGNKENQDYALTFFRGLPYVESVSSADSHPVYSYSGTMIQDESGQSLFSSRFCEMMEDYPKMMGMVMKEGRMPRNENEVAINETYGEWMHWGTELLNRTVYNSGYVCKVVGVIKDFRIGNFTNPQAPFILMSTKNFGNCVHVRLKEPFAENLQKLNKVSADAFPDKTVDFRSMEQMIKESYNSIRVFSNATILAAVTMFFVMMMGLIGYTTDEVRRRSKEIAIRKVNGAEASGILEMLVKDVLYVAVAAVVIGVAASWYVNDMWMDMFAEHVPVSWAAYVLIAIVNLLVIVACVLWKSWRIANENPVNSLKSE